MTVIWNVDRMECGSLVHKLCKVRICEVSILVIIKVLVLENAQFVCLPLSD